MYTAHLTKIETTNPRESDPEIMIGAIFDLPVVGKRFNFYMDKVSHPGGGISTSAVQEIHGDKDTEIVFKTLNTVYKLYGVKEMVKPYFD